MYILPVSVRTLYLHIHVQPPPMSNLPPCPTSPHVQPPFTCSIDCMDTPLPCMRVRRLGGSNTVAQTPSGPLAMPLTPSSKLWQTLTVRYTVYMSHFSVYEQVCSLDYLVCCRQRRKPVFWWMPSTPTPSTHKRWVDHSRMFVIHLSLPITTVEQSSQTFQVVFR